MYSINSPDMERMYVLSAQAFERTTGIAVPDDLKKYLLVVELYDEPIPCAWYSGSCAGTLESVRDVWGNIVGWEMGLVRRDCWPNSSFSHELMHFFGYYLLNDIDADHSDPRLFGHVGSKAATRAADAAGITEGMCGEVEKKAYDPFNPNG